MGKLLGLLLLMTLSSTIGCIASSSTTDPPVLVSPIPDSPSPELPSPLPHRRYGGGGHHVRGEWIVFGGNAPGEDSARETLRFDPLTREWQPLASLHQRHNFVGSVVIDEEIYAVGPAIERYDRANNRWEALYVGNGLPRSHVFAAALEGEIFVLGGFPIERAHLQVFGVATRVLRDGPPLPDFQPGDHFVITATLAGGVHAVGGLDHETTQPETRHWRLQDETWIERAPHPTGVSGKFTAWCVHRDRLYVFEESGHVYDPETNRWTKLAAPPRSRVLPVTIGVGNTLVMLGGLEPVERKNEAWVYEINEDRWRPLFAEEGQSEAR